MLPRFKIQYPMKNRYKCIQLFRCCQIYSPICRNSLLNRPKNGMKRLFHFLQPTEYWFFHSL